jgi:malonyl-CoA/methylmalonyl-CoA synthetase
VLNRKQHRYNKIKYLNTVMDSITANMDRTRMVPFHDGPHVLPNNPLFTRLLRHAHRNYIAITDRELGVSKTYGELLDVVLAFREVVQAALPSQVIDQLNHGEEVYVGVLAAGGYEFAVAVLTVLALGAALVPMCTCILFCYISTLTD